MSLGPSSVGGQRMDCAARKGAAIASLLVTLATAASGSEVALQTIYEFFPSVQVKPFPYGRLAESRDGSFYGTTFGAGYGGDYGMIFRITPAGLLTNLFSFNGTNGAGGYGLIAGDDGCFYGVSPSGGTGFPLVTDGTIFKVDTNGAVTSLFSFSGSDGRSPIGYLAKGRDGRLYGLTGVGGQYDLGTVFAITTNGVLTSLLSFSGNNGCTPVWAGLVQGSDGNFYGATTYGGTNFTRAYTGFGTLFKVTTNGVLNTLVYFNGTNGSNPYSGLTLGSDQSFYGTTQSGGAFGLGTIFRISMDGILTTLLSFDGTNGARPLGDLALGRDGTFYGIASARLEGTNWTFGNVFNFKTNGAIDTVVNLDGTNGRNSFAALTLATDGHLYGTMTDEMKKSNQDGSIGSIFRLAEPPSITSITRPSGAVALSWSSFTNGVYQVQYKPSLAAIDWADLGTNTTATGSTTSFTDVSPGLTERYYRIVLLP